MLTRTVFAPASLFQPKLALIGEFLRDDFDFCLNGNHHESGHSSEDNEIVQQVKTLACDCMSCLLSPRKRWEESTVVIEFVFRHPQVHCIPHAHTPAYIHTR